MPALQKKHKKSSVHNIKSVMNTRYGPSDRIRTCGILLPNVAPYQLSNTRIFNFCHDTTARGKNKDFSVCGHLCGQSRFCAVFGNRRKTRYRPCRKALRAFVQAAHG